MASRQIVLKRTPPMIPSADSNLTSEEIWSVLLNMCTTASLVKVGLSPKSPLTRENLETLVNGFPQVVYRSLQSVFQKLIDDPRIVPTSIPESDSAMQEDPKPEQGPKQGKLHHPHVVPESEAEEEIEEDVEPVQDVRVTADLINVPELSTIADDEMKAKAYKEISRDRTFIGTQEGDSYDGNPLKVLYLPDNFKDSTQGGMSVDLPFPTFLALLALNMGMLMINGLAAAEAYTAAFIRILAYAEGLIAEKHHEEKTDSRLRIVRVLGDRQREAIGKTTSFLTTRDVLSDLKAIRPRVTDIICLLAFGFRSRGHHFADHMVEMYVRLIRKMGHESVFPITSLQAVFLYGLYPIDPNVLDRFWQRSAATKRCNGALIKRINCAAAGTSIVHILSSAIKDFQSFVDVEKLLPVDCKEVKRLETEIKRNRHALSANSNLYGNTSAVYPIDEAKIASLAAVVLASHEALSEDSTLTRAASLKRVAAQRVLTGQLLAKENQKRCDKP